MKPFNLEAALKGEPVMLRNGKKAWVICDTRTLPILVKLDNPITVVTELGGIHNTHPHGNFSSIITKHSLDIVGMWEEPPEMIKIGNFEFPKGETEPLRPSERYYAPELSKEGFVLETTWENDSLDWHYLKRGFMHKTREAAKQHARVLMAISLGKTSLED